MLESRLCEHVTKSLKGRGALVFKIHGHALQQRGWPDLYLAHPAFQGWVELKTGTSLSELQRIKIADLRRRGVWADVLVLSGDDRILLGLAQLEAPLKEGYALVEAGFSAWHESGKPVQEDDLAAF